MRQNHEVELLEVDGNPDDDPDDPSDYGSDISKGEAVIANVTSYELSLGF